MKAKAYPERLNAVLADAYTSYFHLCQRRGHSDNPADLAEALKVLTSFWDPYIDHTKGSIMARDYHGI